MFARMPCRRVAAAALSLVLCARFGAIDAFRLQRPRSLPAYNSLRTRHDAAATSRLFLSSAIENEAANPAVKRSSYSWKKQWYPVLPTSFLDEQRLDKEPYKMKICGEDLVIWKASVSDGEYSIMQDTCPHRRALLSAGKVVPCKSKAATGASDDSAEDTKVLACRYHGWEFDKDGVCTSIPMIPDESERGGFTGKSKAFNVPAYPCKTKGGLLWVYMDPDGERPPPIPDEVCKLFREDDNVMFSVVRNPMSWQSMIENFFDPSHAPFTHEGGRYSPDRAVPMTSFDLMEPISERGFSLQHSPYQLPPKAKDSDSAATNDGLPKSKRWFVAPVTCHAESYNPFMNSTIYFVPTQPGECMTIGVFPGFKLPFVPQMLVDLVQFFYMKNGLYKFLSQDRIIMQSQDARKISGLQGWEDLYPAVADKGVRAFQSWSRTYAGRPEFTLPSPLGKEGRQYSFWDGFAKYNCKLVCYSSSSASVAHALTSCFRLVPCVRTIRRLGWLAKKSKLVSTSAFIGSLGAAVATLLTKQNEIALVKSALVLLLLSVASRNLANSSLNAIDSVFANPDGVGKYKTMQIYAMAK